MKILELISSFIAFSIFNLEPSSRLGEAINFFIYDVFKILLLLFLVNYLMAVIRYYLPLGKMRTFLVSRRWYGFDYFLAAIFGSITPFCSCSSIPLFVGFLRAGIPLGVTISYLTVSPLVNQVAVVLLAGLFGWEIAIWYVLAALFLGVLSGLILGHLKLEKYVASYIFQEQETNNNYSAATKIKSFSFFKKYFWQEAWKITKQLSLYIIIGIALGAAIHGFIPSGFFEKYISISNIWSVPLATIIAVPFYANAIGVIPIMESLVDKGVPLGTAMAFMMATVGLSLPEALILKKVMKLRLLLLFFGITAFNIIIIGYLFNLFAR